MTSTGATRLTEQLSAINDALAEITTIAPSTLTETEHQDTVQAYYRLLNTAEAVKLHLLRGLREHSRSDTDVIDFLTTAPRNLNRTHAGFDVELAKLTDPTVDWDGTIGGLTGDRGTLQMLGAQVAAGNASRAHLDLARKALKDIPTHIRRGTLNSVVELEGGGLTYRSDVKARILDAMFATTAAQYAPGTTTGLVRDFTAMLNHDAPDDPHGLDLSVNPDADDPDGASRRSLTFERIGGITRITIDVDHHSEPLLRRALDAVSAPAPAQCTDPSSVDSSAGASALERDPRTLAQRRYDGLIDLITRGATTLGPADRERATVLVHVPFERLLGNNVAPDTPDATDVPDAEPAQTDGGFSIPDTVLRYLACDARLRTVVHDSHATPLAITTSSRNATATQRAVLTARDRGCVAPGCTAPAGICEAHHVKFWGDGGATELTNLALLCPRHHRAVHQKLLEVRLTDHHPETRWTRPSRHGVKPLGPWTRNDIHHHARILRLTARHLRDDGETAA